MHDARLRNRGNLWGSGRSLTALPIAGCLLSLTLGSGCENRQVAVISLKNRAPEATSIGAYYKLTEPTYRSAGVRGNLDRFGIEAQLGTMGDLDVQVFSYANDVPCSLGSGAGKVRLPGEFRQNLDIDLSTTVSTCSGGQEPADFPSKNMAVWAKAANDIWFAGDGGKILRWNGERYITVPLPASLQSLPPDWTSIVGTTRGEVLIAGNKGFVVRWRSDSTALESVAVTPINTALTGLDWRAASTADPVTGDVWLMGTKGNVGLYTPAAGSVSAYALNCYSLTQPTMPFTRDLNAVSCVATTRSTGPYFDCWFTANQGTLVRLVDLGKTPNCFLYQITPAVTANLNGVWVGANSKDNRLDVRIVGSGTTILRGTAPLDAMIPAPATFDSYKSYLPNGFSSDFLAIGSAPDATGINSTAQVWVTGTNGTVLRWDDTPQTPGSAIPFTLVNTRLTNTIERLSAFGSSVVASGPGHLVFYAGPLFVPRT